MPVADKPETLVGQPAPDATVFDNDGAPVTLRDLYRHGPVVLFFYLRNGTPG